MSEVTWVSPPRRPVQVLTVYVQTNLKLERGGLLPVLLQHAVVSELVLQLIQFFQAGLGHVVLDGPRVYPLHLRLPSLALWFVRPGFVER